MKGTFFWTVEVVNQFFQEFYYINHPGCYSDISDSWVPNMSYFGIDLPHSFLINYKNTQIEALSV